MINVEEEDIFMKNGNVIRVRLSEGSQGMYHVYWSRQGDTYHQDDWWGNDRAKMIRTAKKKAKK